MIGTIFFVSSARNRPAYCLDVLGNLIRCNPSGPTEGLVPCGVELVSSASELISPYPWTITVEAVIERLEFVAGCRPEVRDAYPGLALPVLRYPFVPHIVVSEPDDLVMQAIEILPTLSGGDAITVREQLEASGVFQIPATETFNELIHEVTGEGLSVPPIRYVAAGWMSSMKVFRKALVRSA